jgi:hypothetical protein
MLVFVVVTTAVALRGADWPRTLTVDVPLYVAVELVGVVIVDVETPVTSFPTITGAEGAPVGAKGVGNGAVVSTKPPGIAAGSPWAAAADEMATEIAKTEVAADSR